MYCESVSKGGIFLKKNVLKIVISALLISLSVVLSRLLSTDIPIAGGIPGSRLGIGFLPIMLASILLGPVYGASVGVISDITGLFLFPSVLPYFPPITITSALVGVLPYFIFKILKNLSERYKIFIAVSLTQIICSMFLQTYWLHLLIGGSTYFALFIGRLPVILITIPIYSILLNAVLSSLKRAKVLNHLTEN